MRALLNNSPQLAIEQASLSELRHALQDGLTARVIVEIYLDRIASFDRRGAFINSVLETNPDALRIADALDQERRRGHIRGPLHGIPILIKDNIDTNDRLNTTAGSQLFFGNRAASDATVVARLRDAGAIILGKTVMNEFCVGDAPASRGGMVRHPYAPDRAVAGSSMGSAAAVASGFAAAAIGTDSRGSLRYPAADCSIVSLRPTMGLISRSGIISVDYTIDTVGPMTRAVTDTAILLGELVGFDPRDPLTDSPSRHAHTDYTRFLNPHALANKRIGVFRGAVQESVGKVFDEAIRVLERLGAHLVNDVQIDLLPEGENDISVRQLIEAMDLVYVETYLKNLHPESPIRSLDEVEYLVRNRPYPTLVDLGGLLQRRAVTSWKRYADNFETFLQHYERARAAFFEKQRLIVEQEFSRGDLDAIVFPTKFVEARPMLVNFETEGVLGPCEIASYAGFPELTVPAGYCPGEIPVGISFLQRQPMSVKSA